MICFNFMISMAAKCSDVCGCGQDSLPAAGGREGEREGGREGGRK